MTSEPKATKEETTESWYQRNPEIDTEKRPTTLGLTTSQIWEDDPRRLAITLSRYKSVARMLSGRAHVLEVGCADAFGTRLVLQEVQRLTATDFDQTLVDDALRRMDPQWKFECRQHDLLSGPLSGAFDAAYAIDVIQKIPVAQEDLYIGNIVRSLTPTGVLILGCPSLESQTYASLPGKAVHVNCKSAKTLRALMERFFHNVFLFSMNDEVLHTGVVPMAHYLIAVGSMRRESALPVESVATQVADQNSLDITIVVPCLNEEHNIGPTLDTVVATMMELPHSYEVLVVDDGSTDGTSQMVENYRLAHPELPIRLIRHAANRGLTRSYVDGAFLGRGSYYRLVCGDNAEPKEALIEVFQHIGKAEMIIPYHASVAGKSAFRMALSNLYTTIVNALSGYKIHYYNGLAVHLRYNVMRWGPYSFGFGFQAELITRLLDEGATYVEVPILSLTHREKSGSNSPLNLKNLFSVGHTLTEVIVRRIRKRAFRK